jgi:hypothetical protein
MMRVFLTVFLASILAASTGTRAQTPAPDPRPSESDPPALTTLRARFAESMMSADRSATGLWVATLATLEKERAAAGDYAGAERIQRRRESALAVTGAADGRVSMRLASKDLARKGSGLKEDDASGIITMSGTGAFIEWDVSGDFKGAYEVRLTHAVAGRKDLTGEVAPFAAPAGSDRSQKKSAVEDATARSGWLSFQNISGLKSSPAMVLHREIVSTGGSYQWATVSMGRLEISGRIAKFSLAIEEAGSEPMRFRSLELVPVSAVATAGDGAEKLAKAREIFNREFRNQTQAANNRYRESLARQEQEARRANDNDTLVRLRNEKARLSTTPEQLALGEAGSTASTGPIVLDVLASSASFKFSVRGDITPDSSRTGLTKLRPANTASITWKLAACNVRSGVYNVEIKARVPLNGGGTASLVSTGSAITNGKPLNIPVKPVVTTLTKPKKPEAGTEAPAPENRTLLPGSIVISKGAENLVLTVTELTHPDGGWLMDLSQITLTRTGDVPASGKLP